MPILWRYLLKDYFRVLLLCIGAFVAILLVMRAEEIANFAALGAKWKLVFLFTLYQVPYILPIALPISCLIAALLLFQRLSNSHELTAMMAAGLSLRLITYPLIMAGVILSLTNFFIVSEVASKCRFLSRDLAYEMTTVNPLFLLHKEKLLKPKGSYVDMDVLHTGEFAKNVLFIVNNGANHRLSVLSAKEISLKGKALVGKKVGVVSSLNAEDKEGFDPLLLENSQTMVTDASSFSQVLKKSKWNIHEDYLPLRLLIAKQKIDKKLLKKSSGAARIEIGRRISLGIAPFTFTLIGVCFGTQIGRTRSRKGVLFAMGLAFLALIFYFGAKSFQKYPNTACLFYFLPHPLITFFSLRFSKSISAGVE